MKEYSIYTKGLEYGGMVAAYAVVDEKDVVSGVKKFGYTIDGVEIDRNKGHFIMELIAMWSGLEKVDDYSDVNVFSNDKIVVAKIHQEESTMPYSHFIDWIKKTIEKKNLDVEFHWVAQGTKDSTVIDSFVKPLAIKEQKS